ncbi:PDR/VanB family oxidoreductase [Modestobacter sp. SYSU DS0511]
MSAPSASRLPLRIVHRRQVARSIVEFRLAAAGGGTLPACRTAAHVELVTPSGERRSYSLTSPGSEAPEHYDIAVALDRNSSGGSRSMHADARVGDLLEAAPPRGGFELPAAAGGLLLLAGGVGITPVRPIYHAARAAGLPVRLVYLVRSREDAAYLDEFTAPDAVCHAAAEHGGRRFDLWNALEHPGDTWVFCCGPTALLAEAKALTMHWRPSRLHFEDFSGVRAVEPSGSAFTATWAPTGATYDVGPDETLLGTLEAAGIAVDSSCRSGTCGTCQLRVEQGTVLHRDVLLTPVEQERIMLPCVSRADGAVTVAPV